MTNINVEINKMIRKNAKTAFSLLEINSDNLHDLASLQLDILEKVMLAGTENVKALGEIKDPAAMQSYLESLKTQSEKEINESIAQYNTFYKNYLLQITDVIQESTKVQ